MRIIEAINRVNALKPSQYDEGTMIAWLSELDADIRRTVIDTHEGAPSCPFYGYGIDDINAELIVSAPFDVIYPTYLQMKIDEANGETTRYNNSSAMFNSQLQNYRRDYNRTHVAIAPSCKPIMPKPMMNIPIGDIPVATDTKFGVIKVGDGLLIDQAGRLCLDPLSVPEDGSSVTVSVVYDTLGEANLILEDKNGTHIVNLSEIIGSVINDAHADLASAINSKADADSVYNKNETFSRGQVIDLLGSVSESFIREIYNNGELVSDVEGGVARFNIQDGSDGKSAYEIALDNGFRGSESEWLLSLHGADGRTPVKGIDYFDGTDGKTPVKGIDYFDGRDGRTPIKGVDYFDGISPTVNVSPITNGNRVTITDVNGSHPFDVLNGTDGQGGNVSPSDIADAVEDYLAENPIDTTNKLQFIESNDFKLTNSLQAIIADIDNFNKVMYMGNYPYIGKYDISTDNPTSVKNIFYESFGFASTATNNGKAMSFLARNCVIIGNYIYYAVRNSSGQNMDLGENACNGGIVILQKSDFTVVGHLALPHLVTWVTKYSRNGIDYIFANLRTEGFKLYEVTTNPLVPTLVYDGSLPHDSAATNEHQAGYIVNLPSGKTLYVAIGFANAIFFYDIDDLSNIVLLKKITVGTASNRDVNVGHTYSAYVNYPYLYCTAASSLSLAYKTSGLFRLDISDIENGNVGIKMHLVDESLSSQISAGDMQPSYVERWGNHLLVPANEKGIYVYRLLDDGDIEYESTWVIDSKRVKSEGYDTKPCKIFHCKSDYLGRLFVPESDIMNQSDVSVMSNSREPYRRCHIYKQIKTIK